MRARLVATTVIASLFVANSAMATSLVGYWSGNGNATDTSATANNGSFSGSYAPGFGQAQAFDLSTSTVVIADNPAYSFGPNLSVSFWFNPNGTGGGTFLGQDDGGGGTQKWFIDYGYKGSAFDFHMNDTSNAGVFLLSNAISLPSGWNQLTFIKTGNAYSFTLNSIAIGSGTFTGQFTSSLPDPTAPIVFGFAEGAVPSYRGLIEDVALYNGALAETPLPSTWLMLLSGFVGLGFLAYRGTKKSSAALAAA